MTAIPQDVLERAVDLALEEDAALGDLTSRLTVDATTRARASALAKSGLVVAGLEPFAAAFRRVDPTVAVEPLVVDGDRAKPGDVLARVEGPARSLLAAERVALNFLQRLSGVATLTRQYVDAVPAGCPTRILDTRKTTPGLRAFERHAVRCGGGVNHRSDLAGGILIKDNHIAACGGSVAEAVRRALAGAGPTQQVEVEVATLEQLAEALGAGARAVLLDNMTPALVAEAVKRTAGRAALEVSGGVRLEQVAEFARTGVDFISVGALTHSAAAADVSLELELLP
ncbi:MAG: carboxylating nicotinate-nucleotide diphosphorylase [Deltaproteobacteria bacterium]|nr:carboxylating nicotinate-nucleotide diphosphorylase [Deltaproteobacteria bacterium]